MMNRRTWRAIRHLFLYSKISNTFLRPYLASTYHRLVRLYFPDTYTSSEPFNTVWVDPCKIKHDLSNHDNPHIRSTWEIEKNLNLGRFKPFSNIDTFNSVIEGDWDKNNEVFTDRLLYSSIEMRFNDGCEWSQTPIYYRAQAYLRNNETWKGVKSGNLNERFNQIDNLYNKIKQNGFKSQAELSTGYPPHFDEIKVNIGRDGELIYDTDGAHRLSIAKVLNIDSIPVMPLVRHPEWEQSIRESDSECLNRP